MEHLKTKLLEIIAKYQPLGFNVPALVEAVIQDELHERAISDIKSRLESYTPLELLKFSDLTKEYSHGAKPNGKSSLKKKILAKLNG